MFPKQKKRLWWLPLALILVCVLGTWLWSLISPENQNAETKLSENFHMLTLGENVWYILDKPYAGDFDLQEVCFSTEQDENGFADRVFISVDEPASFPSEFLQSAVLDRSAYETFCETWALTPAFPDWTGRYAVLAYASEGASYAEVQLGDVTVSEDTVTLWLRDRLPGYTADTAGYVLTVPVGENVTRLETQRLYNAQEEQNLKKWGRPYNNSELTSEKPVIYLYPEAETAVRVRLDYGGTLTCTYPAYKNGWDVTAAPDGTLTDAFGQAYNYLYWEGEGPAEYDFSRGFCVRGSDTAAFLDGALAALGLTRREANEFIVYWLPKLEANEWNLLAFQGDAYTDSARLDIVPAPDTLIRVFLAWKPLEAPVVIAPQELTAPARRGFTVVEWGGAECR